MKLLLMTILALVVLVVVKKVMGGGDAAVAKEKIKAGALVLDVRTASEYQGGHYQGAVNIPLNELPGRLGELKEKTRPLVVYCASGMRSARAAEILKTAGFTDVTNAGGLGNL